MAEQFIGILHYKYFGPSMFREMVRSFENCEKLMVWETENRVEKNTVCKNQICVKLRQVSMSGVLYSRSSVEALR